MATSMNKKNKYGPTIKHICIGSILLLLSLLNPGKALGQCENDASLNKCAPKLGSYNYLKSFASGTKPRKKSSNEISYVFSKGSTYIMIACTDESRGKSLVLNLYDMNHNLIASNYNEKTETCYSEIVYPCSATGVYYIRIAYENSKPGCGLCILGFNREE